MSTWQSRHKERDHDSTDTAPPLDRLTAGLAAALVALTLTLPAGAQTDTIFHTSGGTSWNNPKTTLVVFGDGGVETKDLTIAAREWPGTAILGVNRGCHAPAATPKSVSFHNASGKYTGGQPIATACTHQGADRCSRSITVNLGTLPELGLSGSRTFTANRGATVCKANPQQGMNNVPTGTRQTATGMFTVRIWGKVCLEVPFDVQKCQDLKEGQPSGAFLAIARSDGYRATFGPGPHCGPARTLEGLENRTPYAEWCDFTVDIRR